MMRGLHKLAPRSKGQGWDISKVHEIQHMAKDVSRFGAPANTNTGPTEHHHITHAKRPAKTVRHDRRNFDFSVANRYVDNQIIDHCDVLWQAEEFDSCRTPRVYPTSLLVASVDATTDSDDSYVAERFELALDNHGDENIYCDQEWLTKGKNVAPFPTAVTDAVWHWSSIQPGWSQELPVVASTQYQRRDTIFRAHPNHQGYGPWLDWVYVSWEGHGKFPAQIHMIFQAQTNNGQSSGEIMAVVTAAAGRPTPYSVLTRRVALEVHEDGSPQYHVVSGASLGHHTCMFPLGTGTNTWYELLPFDRWASKFVGFAHYDPIAEQDDVNWDGDDDDSMDDEDDP